ncbi:MAG: ribosome maturation factor RimP [Ilumatobacteraceae bacterium]
MATTQDRGAGNGSVATPVLSRVRALVEPLVVDLGLELYDLEQRGGTLRVTIDTPPGSSGSVNLDALATATRLISRELDHSDPIPGRYTLEVTSPGVERPLRLPEHFAREIGKDVALRLRPGDDGRRRIRGLLVASTADTITVRTGVNDDATPIEETVAVDQIEKAHTIFEWGPTPKPTGPARKQRDRNTAPTPHDAGTVGDSASDMTSEADEQELEERA